MTDIPQEILDALKAERPGQWFTTDGQPIDPAAYQLTEEVFPLPDNWGGMVAWRPAPPHVHRVYTAVGFWAADPALAHTQVLGAPTGQDPRIHFRIYGSPMTVVPFAYLARPQQWYRLTIPLSVKPKDAHAFEIAVVAPRGVPAGRLKVLSVVQKVEP